MVSRCILEETGLNEFFPNRVWRQAAPTMVHINAGLESARQVFGPTDRSTPTVPDALAHHFRRYPKARSA